MMHTETTSSGTKDLGYLRRMDTMSTDANDEMTRSMSSTSDFTGSRDAGGCCPATRLGRSLSMMTTKSVDLSERCDSNADEEDPCGPTISDAAVGYASKLPRQASLRPDIKRICSVSDVRDGRAGLQDGTYLYDDLVYEGSLAGHSSLVDRCEFKKGWSTRWKDSDAAFRHTVLFAGELEYEEGLGTLSWNNHSGHYLPDSADHVRVGLDPATFVATD